MSARNKVDDTIRESCVIDKVVRIGCGEDGDVFCRIKYQDKNLSIVGVEGPTSDGNCRGSAGQINGSFRIKEFAPGWDRVKLATFLAIWDEWHLNNMQAGCVHQRKARWVDERIPADELPGSRANRDERGILAIWVYPGSSTSRWATEKHPEGLLCKPCPVCGYKYGSSWLHADVPVDVLRFLEALPETDVKPAWV